MERYEAYKDGGWLGDVPSSWNLVRISSLYDSRNEKVSDKDYPPLSVTMQGILPQLETAAKTQDGDNRKLVKKGDFAINSRSDRRGSCGISQYDGSVSLITNVLRPKDASGMDMRFFGHLFKSEKFSDEYFKQGTGIVDDLWSTNWSRMKNILVCCPDLESQQAIADFLDEKTAEIDGIVSETERSIELLREYRKSVISEAVTKGLDPNAPMKDSGVEWIGELPSGWNCQMLKTVVRNRVEGANAASGQYIGLENIQSWTQKYVKSESVNDDSSGILYDSRCVMFGKLRPYLAKAYVPSGSGPCSSEFLTLIPGCMNRRYLAYLLTSGPFIDEVNSRTYGVKMPRAGWDLIGKIKVPCPPDIVQCAIANYLDVKTAEIDALIADKERQVELLKEYRKSLISEAVTGKFKVPGVS